MGSQGEFLKIQEKNRYIHIKHFTKGKRYGIMYDTRVKRTYVSCLHENIWLFDPNIIMYDTN